MRIVKITWFLSVLFLIMAGISFDVYGDGGTVLNPSINMSAVTTITKTDGTQRKFTGTTDTARGTALISALAASSSGDIITLPPGTFNCGTSQVTFPAGVKVKGAGAYKTYITTTSTVNSGAGSYIYTLSNGSVLEDLSISLNPVIATQSIGLAQDSTVRVNNCYLIGGLDIFYLANTGCTLYLTNCQTYCFYDSIASNVACTVYAYNCDFTALYSATNPSVTTRCIGTTTSGMTYYFFDCRFYCSSSASPASTEVLAIDNSRGGTIYVDGCTFNTSAVETPTRLYDIYGGNVYVTNCRGSGTNGALLTYGSGVVFTDNYTTMQSLNSIACTYTGYNTFSPTTGKNVFATSPVGNLVAGTFTPLASGTVTSANMKISAVDGTAFVDFSEPNALVDYNGKYVVIKDTGGYYISGWINADGSSETLDSELLSNPSFDTNTNGWTATTCTLATLAGGQSGTCLKVTKASGSTQQIASADVTLALGGLYKIDGYLKLGTGSSTCTIAIPGFSVSGTPTSSWVEMPKFGTSTATGAQSFSLTSNTVSLGNNTLWDEVSCKQVTAPSATGVTIASSESLAAANWANKHASFNYADTSYTYAIYESSPGYLWLQAGTATANTAPIKMTAGTVLTLPEQGAIEFDGTSFFATPEITRKTLQYKEDSPNISSGTSAPSTTPTKVGDIFVDTSAHKIYVSDGTTNSGNWVILN